MAARIEVDLTVLEQMTVNQLRKKHQELFGEPTCGRHRQWLVRRIAWRLQSLTEGGLPERARGGGRPSWRGSRTCASRRPQRIAARSRLPAVPAATGGCPRLARC